MCKLGVMSPAKLYWTPTAFKFTEYRNIVLILELQYVLVFPSLFDPDAILNLSSTRMQHKLETAWGTGETKSRANEE